MRRRPLRDPVHQMIRDLSRDHGKCFATEAGLRREYYRRTGQICGERSIGRVIKRSVARGELGHERVAPYHRRVDGDRHHSGTMHTWIVGRQEQRKASRDLRRGAFNRLVDQFAAKQVSLSSLNRKPSHHIAKPRHALRRNAVPDENGDVATLATVRAPEGAPVVDEQHARERSASLLRELVEPRKLADLVARPPVPEEASAAAAELEQRRRDRVAEQLAALERAGFDVSKKPPPDE
jgi:hypothetical protein